MKSYLYELQKIRTNSNVFTLYDGNVTLLYKDADIVRYQKLFDRMLLLTKDSPAHQARIRAARAELDLLSLPVPAASQSGASLYGSSPS